MAKIVALILDPNFGDQVISLAPQIPVWIVASPVNDRAVKTLRSKFEDGRLTTLLRPPNEQPSDTLVRALIAIDDHHGGNAQVDSYEAVDVYGAIEPPSRALLSELGFRSVVATHYGFRAQK